MWNLNSTVLYDLELWSECHLGDVLLLVVISAMGEVVSLERLIMIINSFSSS